MSKKKKLVILTGAGISAESGLQTFRDGDGLWENHRVEDVATPEAFARDPELVLEFYNFRRKACATALPNAAHKGLAALETDFEVSIITQNIDDLHERAGSTQVHHLHGEIFKMRSVANEDVIYDIRADIKHGDLAEDGSQLRPHIVWFGEAVPMIYEVMPIVQSADIFVIIGTSLLVYPAAGLVDLVPTGHPVYVLDKKIPLLKRSPYLRTIEQTASEGIAELTESLKSLL
ncbi:NAD-dependent protein deacylase [Taibaiella sp. KBW10]|uniref:SIR2 family NAD-dependent protein deacylase n=1 Tax=Taibaiella sp. KBW10 TaxID=2153357 RepID=UPI000F5982CB|nr:NAD-dependent deacylase [Taibaiella sp. KBW10]RQO32425.1 NAD-dependent protein deacylase [Taibaiella sp. KBW10]